MAKAKVDWIEMQVDALSERQQSLYAIYGAAYKAEKAAREATQDYRAMKAARQEFEQAMQDGCPDGQKIACSYNYGKLSIALVEVAKKVVKSPVSLAVYLAQRKASGQAA